MMTTCIYDANGMQLCCCIGRSAAIAYLQLFQLNLEDVTLEMFPIERTDQGL
jgi:hypothetical protein